MLQQLGKLYQLPGNQGSPAAGGQGLLHLGETRQAALASLPAPAETSSGIS